MLLYSGSSSAASLVQVFWARLCSLTLSGSMLYLWCSVSALMSVGYLIFATHLSALFWIVCSLSSWCVESVSNGVGGYSSVGRITVVYSLSFVAGEQLENLWSCVSVVLAICALSLTWLVRPVLVKCSPRMFPVQV